MKRDEIVDVIRAYEQFCKDHHVRLKYEYSEDGIRFTATLVGRLDLDGGISITDIQKKEVPAEKKKRGRPKKSETNALIEGVKND